MANGIINCSCPRCSHHGRSVAAIHYEETEILRKQGNFSGSGIGIGTGGISAVIGGGAYSESGTRSTKRAAEFAEPTFAYKPVAGLIAVGLIVTAVLKNFPSFIETITPTSASNNRLAEAMTTSMANIFPVIIGISILGIAIAVGWQAWSNHLENEKAASTDQPNLRARYNELYYCGDCNTLFDRRGNFADANSTGFDTMLNIPPLNPI